MQSSGVLADRSGGRSIAIGTPAVERSGIDELQRAVVDDRSRIRHADADRQPSARARSRPRSASMRCASSIAALAARFLWEWAKIFVVSVVLFVVIRTFLVEAFKIPSGSMEHTLLVGDFLLVNKLVYGAEVPFTHKRLPRLREPQRGDVIVFEWPEDPTKNFVKRLVGLPGDTLEMRDGMLIRNGARVTERYVEHTEPGHRSRRRRSSAGSATTSCKTAAARRRHTIRRETTGVRWSSLRRTTSCSATIETTRSTAGIGGSSPTRWSRAGRWWSTTATRRIPPRRSPGSRTSAGRAGRARFTESESSDSQPLDRSPTRMRRGPSHQGAAVVWPPPDNKKSSYEEGSLDQYLRDISVYPLITREEEVRARAAASAKGDQEALDKLVRSNLRFVVSRREEVSEPGRLALGSDQRGQPRPHSRRAQIRRDEGDQVHLVRGVVDPAGDPPGARRAVAHRARAAQSRRHAASHRQARERAAPGARPRADARRDRATAWTSPRKKSRRRWRSRRRISRSMRR